MFKYQKPFIILILGIAIIISGCTIGMLGGIATQQSGSYELKVPDLGAKQDILIIAEIVGKELGYKIHGKSQNSVSFQYQTNFVVGMALGTMRMYTIMVSKAPDIPIGKGIEDKDVRQKIDKMQKELTITVISVGDYGAGGVDHAEKLANEFKDKLLQRAS